MARLDLRFPPRPLSDLSRKTPSSDNTVPVSKIRLIARFLMTNDALLSALSVCPHLPHTKSACDL
ncbi:hypothetical protein, partial [Shewanella inventionis]|uniref:hypothetical protein n=1 Tax=Shewanella inventionis TaxID=1738770 RepID=UPI001E3A1D04